jgi:deoxyribonuclease-4
MMRPVDRLPSDQEPAERLLFGTAGVPKSSPHTSTLSGVRRIRELGLDCQEVEFVQGVKMGESTAREIRGEAERLGVALSVHAPYWVNLNSREESKRLMSQQRLLHSARLAKELGARSVVFHSGFYHNDKPEDVFETMKKGLQEVVSILNQERNPVVMRPEVMGKKSQFGGLEEILFLCQEVKGLQPCLDFSHIYSREGKANTYLHFHRILTKLGKKLGDAALKDAHIHISGQMYNDKGEMKHLNLSESDFRYDDWIQALKDFDVKGMVICESPDQEGDALMLRKLYYG